MSAPSIVPTARSGGTGKIVSAREAARLIRTGDTVAVSGFAGIGVAEEVIHELAEIYKATDTESAAFGKPKDLTLLFGVGQGHPVTGRGLNRLAEPGLIKRVIGGHFNFIPAIQRLVVGDQIEGYNLPLGPIIHLYRDIAAGKPGHLSKIGLGTFVDPRFGGGKLNASTVENIVELVTLGGNEYLFYKSIPINVGIIRGTTADPDGNITMEREALTIEALSLATAAHNSGGLVIAQVERIAEPRTLNPRQVKIPGVMVDCIVVAQPENHTQTYGVAYNPAYASELRVPVTSIEPMAMSERKVIARRAAMELRPNSVINLGVGMPEGVAMVANEEKIGDLMTLTAEPGVIGGIPAGGFSFGAAVNADAILDIGYQFDFYDGGGLDMAFLGLAQADKTGSLNVSKFGPRLAGAGGFINISQNAKKVVFCGTLTAGDLDVSIVEGKLVIERDGKQKKFVDEVEHRTFSGAYAADIGKEVIYVTERCVFRLTKEGLELTEIAPGVDVKRDILDQMEFTPIVREPKLMDARIFADEPMGLRDELLKMPFDARFRYDEEHNILFLNFENLEMKSLDLVKAATDAISSIVGPLGHKVYAVVNYDGFVLDRDVEAAYLDAVQEMGKRYFLGVTRFTTSAFMHAKLGDALANRGVAPHIYESETEAKTALRGIAPRR
ncbi:acyl CoA:acetate/3-ketoacid CoA transferase [Methylopila sp. M107]|uniref:acyl CoA:acetate/3-ketoacid CoA transferase n=1 Tax=Methylopila sp. M107 TaxID=1101190 RepID=UPI0003827B2D|nr:acyl CoA:acetate/3-ketoacid CoA transferase [Methylopila sp. M107]